MLISEKNPTSKLSSLQIRRCVSAIPFITLTSVQWLSGHWGADLLIVDTWNFT